MVAVLGILRYPVGPAAVRNAVVSYIREGGKQLPAVEVVVPMRAQHLTRVNSVVLSPEEATVARSSIDGLVASFVTSANEEGALRSFFRGFAVVSDEWPAELRVTELHKLKRVFRTEAELSVLDTSMLDPGIFSQGAKLALKMLAGHGSIGKHTWFPPDLDEQLALTLW